MWLNLAVLLVASNQRNLKRTREHTEAYNPVVLLLAAALAFTSLPLDVRELLVHAGLPETAFPAFIQEFNRQTVLRVEAGEREHLVFFVLQSKAFTQLPAIEPAVSSAEWKKLGYVPAGVQQRVLAFLEAAPRGERMRYLREIIPKSGGLEFVLREYNRTMASLYRKEFAQTSDFYQTRGHSTDTGVVANYSVWSALRVIRTIQPDLRLERALVIGPGLDFAPRTGFDERYEPQSYQPFAVADALLGLKLARAPAIDCIDVNPRVIRFFRDFQFRPQAELRLTTEPGDQEYLHYFSELGSSIGVFRSDGLTKTLSIQDEVRDRVSARLGNVVSERIPQADYDLVVATNVLVYYKEAELLLAISNVAQSLKPGGFFVTNELRPVMDLYATATGLKPVQARTIRVAQGSKTPLYDGFAIYAKR